MFGSEWGEVCKIAGQTLSLFDCTLVMVCNLKSEHRDSKYSLMITRNCEAASACKRIIIYTYTLNLKNIVKSNQEARGWDIQAGKEKKYNHLGAKYEDRNR